MKYTITKLPLVTNHIRNTVLTAAEKSGDTAVLSIKVEIHQTLGEKSGNYPFFKGTFYVFFYFGLTMCTLPFIILR